MNKKINIPPKELNYYYNVKKLPINEITKIFRCSDQVIWGRLREYNILPNRWRFSKGIINNIINDYSGGMSIYQVAEKNKCSYPGVWLILKKHDISLRPRKYTYGLKGFDITPEISYLTGLIITDGHLRHTQIVFSFQEREAEHFRDVVCNILKITPKLKITYTAEDGVHIQGGFRISRKRVCEFFHEKMNIPYGNKTYTCRVPSRIFNTSKENVESFLMGVIDGDGDIGKDYSMGITSGSKNFIFDIQKLLLKYNITSKIKYRGDSKAMHLNISKLSAPQLYGLLVCSSYYLSRKFDRIKYYIENTDVEKNKRYILPETEKEMLRLRKKGYSYDKIGKITNTNSSTVCSHTKHLGVDIRTKYGEDVVKKVVELREKEGKTFYEINKILNIKQSAYYLYHKTGRVDPKARVRIQKQELIYYYNELKLPLQKIADIFNKSKVAITYNLRAYGVPRNRGNQSFYKSRMLGVGGLKIC